ncbi:MAG: SpoIIE family protein phosphatase [Bdellovibrionales bacterium]|nr:SpoIIE family protein phosphatase [Bdellovibrionales bacterium]
MAKNKFPRVSIQYKLMLYAVTLIVLLGAFLTINSVVSESSRIMTTFTNSARKTTQFISNSIRDSIKNRDLDSVEQILLSADVNPNITKVQVTDRVGIPLYAWTRSEGIIREKDKISDRNLDAIMDSRGWVVHEEDEIIRIGGVMQTGEEQVFGYILVTFNTHDITEFIAANTQKTIYITLIYMLIIAAITFLLSGYAVRNLNLLRDATSKVAKGDYSIRVNLNSNDELGDLAKSFNKMAAETSRLLEEKVEKARMESELAAAREVQSLIFPANKATIGPIKISGLFSPASECGGDWWHYHESPDYVYLWIGDATGHGVPAAMITSVAKTISTVVEEMGDLEPSEILTMLNRAVYAGSKSKIQMTFFIGAFNKKTGKFKYSKASHDPPYIIPASQTFNRKELEVLIEPNSHHLGREATSEFAQGEIQLKPGETIFFYTDGLVDVFGSASRLERFITNSCTNNNSPCNLVDKIEDELNVIKNSGHELLDDVTLFTCQYVK